jgi:hypothetical protein
MLCTYHDPQERCRDPRTHKVVGPPWAAVTQTTSVHHDGWITLTNAGNLEFCERHAEAVAVRRNARIVPQQKE